jgi:cell division septum initiation protein DivIVA
MKLFTLFRSDERALRHVAEQRKRIDRLVERIEGREEWGLRVLLDEVGALHAARTEAQAASGGAPGAAFLLRKKKEQDAAREVIEHARDRADGLFELLAGKADDARRRPPPPGEMGKRVLLDAAFLLPRSKVKAFQAAVRAEAKKLSRRHYQLTLTGPWPAYTFVADPERK